MPTDFPVTATALAGLVPILSIALLTWLASLVRRDVSLVDRVWALLIVGAGAVYYYVAHYRLSGTDARGATMLLIALAWALRLSGYVTVRNWGHGEDRRYQAIRARNEPNFAFKSLYLIFALQAVLAWIVSTPMLVATASTRPLGGLDLAGLVLAAFGTAFEAVGDWQMARFKADAAHRGQVMDRGLWAFTRHPNYFGEACIWWGFWLVALGAAGWQGSWTVVSPILMTVLLVKVSGAALLEKDIGERRPAYRDYIQRTNAFFPGPRRRTPR